MTLFTLFLALDFGAACAAAFYCGWCWGRDHGHSRGFRAGASWAGRVAAHFADERSEPTSVSRR